MLFFLFLLFLLLLPSLHPFIHLCIEIHCSSLNVHTNVNVKHFKFFFKWNISRNKTTIQKHKSLTANSSLCFCLRICPFSGGAGLPSENHIIILVSVYILIHRFTVDSVLTNTVQLTHTKELTTKPHPIVAFGF